MAKVFTDHVYFTEGYCHTLALWFHEHMGYELRLLSGALEGDHALVKVPGGLYLDIRGLQTREELKRYWKYGRLQVVSKAYFQNWSAYAAESSLGPFEARRLTRVVKKLMKNLVTLKCTQCLAQKVVERTEDFYDFKVIEIICPTCKDS